MSVNKLYEMNYSTQEKLPSYYRGKFVSLPQPRERKKLLCISKATSS